MKQIMLVFGTRPEAIKMVPVIKELQKHPEHFNTFVCVTAQHRRMLDQVLDVFDICPDFDLDIMQPGQDLYDITCKVLLGMRDVYNKVTPDLVLVHGDTTTSMAATMAAFYAKIPIGHIEAGLRTHNKYAPFPEEANRRITGAICDLHFAPTQQAAFNLMAEGVSKSSIHVTGNTVIDALFMATDKLNNKTIENNIIRAFTQQYQCLEHILSDDKVQASEKSKLILVTGHRRENFGPGFENICLALHDIAIANPDVDILYPVHLNPQVQEPVKRILRSDKLKNIHLIDPVDYLPFVWLMNRSYLIITDSGGIQEEAPSLGKPVLVMRDSTERPESIAAGTVRLVGTDRSKIVVETQRLLSDEGAYKTMSMSHNPYGDGLAATRIVSALRN